MTIFAIMGTARVELLDTSIATNYPGQFYRLSDNQWFVFDKISSMEVSDKIGLTDGSKGEGIVLTVSGYWGFTGRTLWEWLASREGSPGA